ncbi:MAG: hypothetical protein HOD97_01630 [Candidatus Marinimicrobia bacterium]|nr:hypothetical protein [Candidatus Neomarinimicrobiota bacterium]
MLVTFVLPILLVAQRVDEVVEEIGEGAEEVGEQLGETFKDNHENEYDDVNDEPKTAIEWQHEEDTITDEIIFYKDHVIVSGEVSYDNIRIIGGDLIVDGTVKGKITLIGGDARLNETAVLDGQIVVVGGKVQKHGNVVINGKIIESNIKEGLLYRETDPEENIQGTSDFELEERSERARKSWIHPEGLTFVYNRNEGLLLNFFHKRWDRRSLSSFRITSSMGVRMKPHHTPDYTGRLTMEKTFGLNRNITVFGSGFKESRTDDAYRLPQIENTLASFLGKQDFYDRWDEIGWEAGFGLDISRLKIKAAYSEASHDSISVADIWSLFEKNRILRENVPVIHLEKVKTTEVTAAFRTKDYHPLNNGLALFAQSEWYKTNLDSGQQVNRIMAMGILNWEIAEGIVLRTRLMGGTSTGDLLPHRDFGVGGIGSVSAHPYKDQTGNQFVQSNVEFIITPEFTDSEWLVKLFADGGHAWDKSDYAFEIEKIKTSAITSVGIGIGNGDGDDDLNFIVNIAKPMNAGGEIETTVRVNYNF